MSGSRTISESKLYIISLIAAVLCFGNIYYQLGIAPNWQWGPALDKMPKQLVENLRVELYTNAKGGYAAKEYTDGKLELNPAIFPEFVDGVNAKSTLKQPLIGDGRTVTAIHDLEVNGTTKTVVDVIHIGPRGGRIDSITRYVAE